ASAALERQLGPLLLTRHCRHLQPPIAAETPRAVKLERFGSGRDGWLQVPAMARQQQRAELAFESGGR
ncbi:hypothetical protein XarbCFBP8150_21880, partial [Xanthomonas arboricola]